MPGKKDILKIGISACIMHADPTRAIFKGKPLVYAVGPMNDWLLRKGMMPLLVPCIPSNSQLMLEDYVDQLDGLILQGGADVDPECYGEIPMKPEWNGDRVRDLYEIELIEIFRKQKKPILGICRGLQILNVAMGGSLYQDINHQLPNSLVHRNWDIYDQNFHTVELLPDSYLSEIYRGSNSYRINSVHHQGIKKIAPGLVIEAVCPNDGVIEAVRSIEDPFVMGVQWHPEFQSPVDSEELISPIPLLRAFESAVRIRREANRI